MTINTNLSAIQVENAVSANNAAMQGAMQQLSTGSAINTAADDPAGLAISQGLQTQIGGLNQAAQNVSEGINLIQTASGALTQVSDILQQVNTLIINDASDTNDAASRADIQQQVHALGRDVYQIGESTNYNGIDLLNGKADLEIQVGSSGTPADQFNLNLVPDEIATNIGGADIGYQLETLPLATGSQARASINDIQSWISKVATMQAGLGAAENELTSMGQSIAINSENLTAANSTISDTNMATEMSNYTKDSVLVQAGTAMLSQANQNDQLVLKLLQG